MTDDAPQFNKLALDHVLCWIHEGRHYKKLNPFSDMIQKILDAFLEQFWDFYHALLTYKAAPSQSMTQQLSMQFDTLFVTTTGYDILAQRIAKTRAKKQALLLVLDHPFLPLHNNGSELGARFQARIRDINFQTISPNGTKSKDTFATIVLTARKLKVNVYQYIYDRVTKKFEMPSLAELILLKAQYHFLTQSSIVRSSCGVSRLTNGELVNFSGASCLSTAVSNYDSDYYSRLFITKDQIIR